MPISIAVGLAPAFYPRHSPVGAHNAERILPAVPRWGAKDFVQDAKQAGSVFFVDTARPSVNECRFFRREAVQLAKAIIPIYTTGTGIPRPGAPSRGVDGDTQPLFAVPQRLFGAGAFDRFPDAFCNITDQFDLSIGPDTWRRAMDTETGDPLLVFYDHYAGKCRDLSRPQMGSLAFGEPRIGGNVVYYDRLAAFVGFQQPFSKGRNGTATD